MFSKRKIKAFISFNWYWFLVIFFVVSVAFYYLFDVIKNPSYDERINMFIAINYVDSNKMEKDLYEGYDDTQIKEISVDYSDPNDNYFNMVYQTRGLVNTDILILPISLLKDTMYSQYFSAIDDNIIKQYTDNNINFVNSENVNYGINVTNFIASYTNEINDEYYMFFNKKSNKIGALSKDTSNNDYALKLISNILRKE